MGKHSLSVNYDKFKEHCDMEKIILNGEKETAKLGLKLGQMLKTPSVVCLTGDLGAGKTTFTKSIAKGLGIEEHITSPTFTIVNEYEGREKLYHFDVYRISSPEEMHEIGFEEYLASDGVCIIEWADMIKELLEGVELLWIEIRYTQDMQKREVEVSAVGEKYEKIIRELL